MIEDPLDKLMGIEPRNGDDEPKEVVSLAVPTAAVKALPPAYANTSIPSLLTMENLEDPSKVQSLIDIYLSLKDEESVLKASRKSISDFLNAAADRIGCDAISGTSEYFDCAPTFKTDWDIDRMAFDGVPCVKMEPKLDKDKLSSMNQKDADAIKAEYATTNVPVRGMVGVVKIKTGKAKT